MMHYLHIGGGWGVMSQLRRRRMNCRRGVQNDASYSRGSRIPVAGARSRAAFFILPTL